MNTTETKLKPTSWSGGIMLVYFLFSLIPSYFIFILTYRMDINLLPNYGFLFPQSITETATTFYRINAPQTAGSLQIVYLFNMVWLVAFLFYLIRTRCNSLLYEIKNQETLIRGLISLLFISGGISWFFYRILFRVNITDYPDIKSGPDCGNRFCYLAKFFWQDFLMWQNLLFLFVLSFAGFLATSIVSCILIKNLFIRND